MKRVKEIFKSITSSLTFKLVHTSSSIYGLAQMLLVSAFLEYPEADVFGIMTDVRLVAILFAISFAYPWYFAKISLAGTESQQLLASLDVIEEDSQNKEIPIKQERIRKIVYMRRKASMHRPLAQKRKLTRHIRHKSAIENRRKRH